MGIKFRKIKSKTPSELSLTGFGEVPSGIEPLYLVLQTSA